MQPGFPLRECTHRRGIILRFAVLELVESEPENGVKKPFPRNFYWGFFGMEMVYSSVFLMQNACNGRILSLQTANLLGILTLGVHMFPASHLATNTIFYLYCFDPYNAISVGLYMKLWYALGLRGQKMRCHVTWILQMVLRL